LPRRVQWLRRRPQRQPRRRGLPPVRSSSSQSRRIFFSGQVTGRCTAATESTIWSHQRVPSGVPERSAIRSARDDPERCRLCGHGGQRSGPPIAFRRLVLPLTVCLLGILVGALLKGAGKDSVLETVIKWSPTSPLLESSDSWLRRACTTGSRGRCCAVGTCRSR
jgi:hypothetical protein